MTRKVEPAGLRYVDVAAMRYLMRGLTFNLNPCAEVLDHALIGLNEKTNLPDRLCAWIRAGAHQSGPVPCDGPRVIVDLTERMSSDGKHGYFAVVIQKSGEVETAPVVFLSMHSPALDIPMRVEVPLRALLKGNPPVKGTHTLYLHALLTDRGDAYVYYGITKRGWSLRFKEHTRAAIAEKSQRLLARTLNDLIEARAAERMGQPDARPKLSGIITSLCSTGLTREAAMEAEERMIDKFSLAAKYPLGLNMSRGGKAKRQRQKP